MEISDELVTKITRELLKRLAVQDTRQESKQGRRNVISEADIKRLCPASLGQGQSAEIGARDIITPLANDYITKMQITVNRVG